MINKVIISLDIGGTWIKGTVINCEALGKVIRKKTFTPLRVRKVRSNLSQDATSDVIIHALSQLLSLLKVNKLDVCGVGVSTAGVVSYAGERLLFTAPHLSPLKEDRWIQWIRDFLHVHVMLVNDADAVSIAAATLHYMKGNRTVGVMPIGTGVGFSVWRNGRRWNPFSSYTLLGCISTPEGSFDQAISAVTLANLHPDRDLSVLLKDEKYDEIINSYLYRLSHLIRSSYYIYHTEEILIGGGLAEAVIKANYPLVERLNELLENNPLVDGQTQTVRLLREGNQLSLLGAALVGYGESIARRGRVQKKYSSIVTEKAFDTSLHLEQLETTSLVHLFWEREQDAGNILQQSIGDISEVADKIVDSLRSDGRLIYVGTGTSGRLAAIDTVELACTFGLSRDRVLTLIAGGLADATFDIETRFEEDASSIPDLLMASIDPKDIVIGISVSGSAYYVQSALAYAKNIGATSILIQEEPTGFFPFCDKIIALRSGCEVIAGSTRMKGGTATKKVLNFLSTTAMIRLGKVHGCYMTNLECINEKLILRACQILTNLYKLTDEDADILLKKNNNSLSKTIEYLSK